MIGSIAKDFFVAAGALIERASAPVSPLRRAKTTAKSIVLVPGDTAPDAAMVLLRDALCRAGFGAVQSGLVVHLQSLDAAVRIVEATVWREYVRTGAKVTLVGHSRGSAIVHRIAREHPEWVDCVIKLGGAGNGGGRLRPELHRIVGALAPLRHRVDEVMAEAARPLPPSVQEHSIHGTLDQMVDRSATYTPRGQNHEVRTSHAGLTVCPKTSRLVVSLCIGAEADPSSAKRS